MIETDLARIASALETLADAYCRQVDTTARFLSDDGGQVRQMTHEELGLANAQVVSEAQPDFVKPKAGPGRGHKKPKPDAVQNVDTTPENPTQADTTAPAAEVPDTVPETDTSPASPSEPAPESPAPVIPEVTLEDVSRAVVEMAKVKTRDEIMAVWKPFGISRGSELKPDQFFDALMAIKEAMRA